MSRDRARAQNDAYIQKLLPGSGPFTQGQLETFFGDIVPFLSKRNPEFFTDRNISQFARSMAQMILAESSGNPNARNPKYDARGLGQFRPGTWGDLNNPHTPLGREAQLYNLTFNDRYNPAQSATASAINFRRNIHRFRGSIPLAVAAHHMGSNGVAEYLRGDRNAGPETRAYVKRITGLEIPKSLFRPGTRFRRNVARDEKYAHLFEQGAVLEQPDVVQTNNPAVSENMLLAAKTLGLKPEELEAQFPTLTGPGTPQLVTQQDAEINAAVARRLGRAATVAGLDPEKNEFPTARVGQGLTPEVPVHITFPGRGATVYADAFEADLDRTTTPAEFKDAMAAERVQTNQVIDENNAKKRRKNRASMFAGMQLPVPPLPTAFPYKPLFGGFFESLPNITANFVNSMSQVAQYQDQKKEREAAQGRLKFETMREVRDMYGKMPQADRVRLEKEGLGEGNLVDALMNGDTEVLQQWMVSAPYQDWQAQQEMLTDPILESIGTFHQMAHGTPLPEEQRQKYAKILSSQGGLEFGLKYLQVQTARSELQRIDRADREEALRFAQKGFAMAWPIWGEANSKFTEVQSHIRTMDMLRAKQEDGTLSGEEQALLFQLGPQSETFLSALPRLQTELDMARGLLQGAYNTAIESYITRGVDPDEARVKVHGLLGHDPQALIEGSAGNTQNYQEELQRLLGLEPEGPRGELGIAESLQKGFNKGEFMGRGMAGFLGASSRLASEIGTLGTFDPNPQAGIVPAIAATPPELTRDIFQAATDLIRGGATPDIIKNQILRGDFSSDNRVQSMLREVMQALAEREDLDPNAAETREIAADIVSRMFLRAYSPQGGVPLPGSNLRNVGGIGNP